MHQRSVLLVVLMLTATPCVMHPQSARPPRSPRTTSTSKAGSATATRPVQPTAIPATGGASAATVDQWIRDLGSADVVRSEGAVPRLAAQGPRIALRLAPLLDADDPQVRRLAAWALAEGAVSPAAVPALTAFLERIPREEASGYALLALQRLGGDASPAAGALGRLLDDSLAFNEYGGALKTAAAMGPAAAAALPAVLRKLSGWERPGDPAPTAAMTPAVRAGAVNAAVAIGGDDAFTALRAELLTPTGEPRMRVAGLIAEGLVQFGPAGRPVLEQAVRSVDPVVRMAATRALSGYGAAAVPALVGALQDRRPCDGLYDYAGCPEQAVAALGRIGPPAVAALPALRQTLRDAQTRPLQDLTRRAIAAIEGTGSQ